MRKIDAARGAIAAIGSKRKLVLPLHGDDAKARVQDHWSAMYGRNPGGFRVPGRRRGITKPGERLTRLDTLFDLRNPVPRREPAVRVDNEGDASMTNWQRVQWQRAGYPRDKVEAFAALAHHDHAALREIINAK